MADQPEVPRREELIEFGKADRGGPRRGREMLQLAHRLDRSRGLVIVSVCIVVTALNVALVGWATRDTAGEATPAGSTETHGLTPDQAACFAFSRIESRVSITLTAREHGSRSTLTREIELLDQLSSDYPSADYRLIVGFHQVGDASVRLLASRDAENAAELAPERASILNAARDICLEVGHFDTRTAEPVP